MQKELNSELFGEVKTASRNLATPKTALDSKEPHFLNTDKQIFEIKSQVHQMQIQMDKMINQMGEYAKATQLRMDKIQQSVQRLEQNHNGLAVEAGQKISLIHQKVGERKNLDMKIQEMVDRHNNVIRSFEVRLNQLQKLLQEKDAQIIAAQAAFNEAKMEMARLKRL